VYVLRFVDAGLSLSDAAEACGVSERTFRRWEADNRAPLAVLKLLRLLSGRLDVLDSAFSRFWIRQGRLFNDQFPDGLAAGDLLAANYTRQERDILRAEIGKLKAQISAMTQTSAPSNPKGRVLVVPDYFPTSGNFDTKNPENRTPHVHAQLSRNTPRWIGFAARAGPKNPATQNTEKRPESSGMFNTEAGAPLRSFVNSQNPNFVISQNHKMLAIGPRQRADAKGSGSPCIARAGIHSFIENQLDSCHHISKNLPSGTSGRERQACRHLPMLMLPVTHGCVTPESRDGRASLHPAPFKPPAALLASLAGARIIASRPVSGSSSCTEVQDDSQKSGDISSTKYLLCEVANTATKGQADDTSTLSTDSPEAASFAGCKSVTPGFNGSGTVYALRFVDAGLSLSDAAEACGVSERTFRRWEADNRAPLAVLKLLRLLSGRLDVLDPAFNGFWIRQGRLFNDQIPNGLTAGDLRATNYVREERDILRTEIGKLRAQLSAVAHTTTLSKPNGRVLVVPAYFPFCRNFNTKNPENGTPHVYAWLSRTSPRWFGFAARAGPQMIATDNLEKRPESSGMFNTDTRGAALCSFVNSQNHKMPAVITTPRADAGSGSDCAARVETPSFASVNQNPASGTSDRERQACRYLPNLTAPVTHGCVTPKSTDGRASLHPAPSVPPAVPLASLCGAEYSAARPVSGSSPCADAQANAQKSGDITSPDYLLCEVGFTATKGQADDTSTLSTDSPEAASFAGCKSVTPSFNGSGTVYALRFVDAGLSLSDAAQVWAFNV
jgi:transcriptional regulator with XRE-family HTH domain